ncbi:hypothetical protein RO3G_13860 [Rhizopus delemar RA 99-880]|uniref:Transposase Tc1-like domain-containing protein n=1 Tax=Rhizopus delemar (strain RA 99-880 / ATCC MYA-4621 / FGSC 9543 / NRRL 43880) TaxID=246409 RepID=I1CL19_RHIO9|nr:hypothetical protein RO3G_13860 [Rhizopus delemar RA 99-880]|eukprot:EIE89149.1 hypothetical protein RO3G_13860 [Rhizopus delemar RA 99-880]
MPKKISNDKREAVKSGIRSGRTTMDISRTTGVSKWTINRIRKEEKNIKARNRGGRPVVVKKITNAIIRLKFRQGLLRTASDAQLFLRSLGYSISKRSVRRLLRKIGFKSGIKKYKPFISYTNQKKRLKWCRDKASWTVEDWKSVIFSDETKINVWGADGIRYYWKQVDQPWRSFHVNQTMKHGGGSVSFGAVLHLEDQDMLIEYMMAQ